MLLGKTIQKGVAKVNRLEFLLRDDFMGGEHSALPGKDDGGQDSASLPCPQKDKQPHFAATG